ncbi:gamma-glutamylcyclotransferase family protein [Thalassotalea psychrophila]|uniref:Gamma-glutamylcyclotransferase family protein n=1 Tax=Thalassotalea psychrophila TaxID=3065647 RepID=A0ABY9TVQ5_9GAMM|nr:gamma-glutamylcyclotransferase family protein [Colwelliaceae bacterium SQ149]
MKYFAYGSNMSLVRLRERVPSAEKLGLFILEGHQLRFHNTGEDGSGKCDAFQTNSKKDIVIGALFEINKDEKSVLDNAESLGYGYNEKIVKVKNCSGEIFSAFTYYAIKIDSSLKPFYWYHNHVVIGAKETNVPSHYLAEILSIECIEDPDSKRDYQQRKMYL